jgi:hypothetical protein
MTTIPVTLYPHHSVSFYIALLACFCDIAPPIRLYRELIYMPFLEAALLIEIMPLEAFYLSKAVSILIYIRTLGFRSRKPPGID